MKRTIVLLSAVLLVSAVATAGVSNPDGFEGYALTTAWNPTIIGEGWILDQEGSMPPTADNFFEIATGTNGNATNVFKVTSGHGANMESEWHMSIPDADVAVTKTSFEFQAAGYVYGSEYRFNMNRNSGVNWASTWGLYFGYGSSWGWGNPVDGTELVTLSTYDYNADVYPGPGFEQRYTVTIPDMEGFEPTNGVWYVVEVEEDNGAYDYAAWVADPVNNHGSSTRARVGIKGGAMGAWTGWLIHDAGDNYGLNYDGTYGSGGEIWAYTGGVNEFDNFSMTPEPATMLLLGAGSLLLVKRKRKS